MWSTFDYSEIRYYLEDNADKIFIAIGITSLTIGLFLFQPSSIISLLGFFFSMTFIFTGILIRTGVIVDNVSRAEKVGAVLIVVSVILFAGSFSCFLFREIGRVIVVVPFGSLMGKEPRVFEIRIAEFSYPFLWLVKPFFFAGLGSLIAGIVLKNR